MGPGCLLLASWPRLGDLLRCLSQGRGRSLSLLGHRCLLRWAGDCSRRGCALALRDLRRDRLLVACRSLEECLRARWRCSLLPEEAGTFCSGLGARPSSRAASEALLCRRLLLPEESG